MIKIKRLGLIAGVAFAMSPVFNMKADDTSELDRLKTLVQELDQKIKILERKDEIAEEDAAKKAKEAPVIKVDSKGVSLLSADKANQFQLRGLLQVDNRSFISPDNTNDDGFLVRRARPIFQGKLFNAYEFVLQPDFGPVTTGGAATIQDAFINVNYWKEFQVKAGRFKGPFGLERSQSSSQTAFIEAGITQNLTPNFDHGVLFNGVVQDGLIQYGVGAVNGVGDNQSAGALTDDEYHFVGSLFTHPFKKSDIYELQGLGFGFATTIGNRESANGTTPASAYVTPGQQAFFTYNSATGGNSTIADGEAVRLSPNGYYYYGPFGVLGEYIISSQDVKGASNGAFPNNRDNIKNKAWQVVANYVITGEDASYKGVTNVKNPFDFKNGGWGAWEVVARYGEFYSDPAALRDLSAAAGVQSYANAAQNVQTWGLGLNWYLNNTVKVQLTYDYTSFNGQDTRGFTADRGADEQAILSRLQIAF